MTWHERVRGAVAQLGERDTGSVEVRGSSPLSSTTMMANCQVAASSCENVAVARLGVQAAPGRFSFIANRHCGDASLCRLAMSRRKYTVTEKRTKRGAFNGDEE